MPEPQVDFVQALFVLGALLLSIVTGAYLIYLGARGPILRYEARRPVPWGFIACILVALSVASAFSAAWQRLQPVEPAEKGAQGGLQAADQNDKDDDGLPASAAEQAGGAVFSVFIVCGFTFVIAVLYRATPDDLGLPTGVDQFARDVFIGVVACVAALAPVHIIQVLLRYLLHMQQGESGHEIIKMLTEGGPNIALMVVASGLAVVVAPLCEELTFRLLFQGWLEKCEDDLLGWRTPPEAVVTVSELITPTEVVAAAGEAGQPAPKNVQPLPPNDPPQLGLLGLPYGWLPILVSATLFGLAHLGYGPEPVPIFVLGLFLGYLYQRTHRIAPSIICHAAFNLFTMSQLWWRYLFGAH
jgi:membrane protease YdiL (CAAX protease family)